MYSYFTVSKHLAIGTSTGADTLPMALRVDVGEDAAFSRPSPKLLAVGRAKWPAM